MLMVLKMSKSNYARGTPTPTIPPSPITPKSLNKGQLSLKSSPYASNNKRAVNQNEVINSLNVHYKKLGSAKSRIDSSVPKAWTSSTIKRDQLKRQALEKQRKKNGSVKALSRPGSRNTMASNLDDLGLDEDLANYGITDSQAPRSAPMTPTKAYRPHSTFSNTHNRPHTSQTQLYQTSSTYGQAKNMADLQGTTTHNYRSRTPRKESADILDKRAQKFTESSKMHTPRTLKTTATSRLAQSKNYNPPKRKASAKGMNDTRKSDRHGNCDENNARNLQSREQLEALEGGHGGRGGEKARLRRAEDHLRWVEEQALRVQSLDLNDDAVYDDHDERGAEEGLGPLRSPSPGLKPIRKKGGRTPLGASRDLNVSYGNESLRSELATMTYRTQDQISKRMQEEEEELRYLEFVTDVTNDVLNRGIYTNTVLKQVFESHIDKNKDRLDEGRMKHLMQQLREDLAIPADQGEGP